MKNLEQLKQEKRELIDTLRGSILDKPEVFEQIKKVEQLIKVSERAELIRNVNAKQARIRDFARQAYECEQPVEDITCSDGSFHKTKVKKYPKIAALQYARAEFKDGLILELSINGERFRMFKVKYDYNKPNEYTRPETFADFLELNNIMPEDMTAEKFNEISTKLDDAKKEIEKNIEDYKKKLDVLNHHSLSCWGLVGQSAEHLYTYTANK